MKKTYLIIWLTISLLLTWCWNQKIENNNTNNTWTKIQNNINTTWEKINSSNNNNNEKLEKINNNSDEEEALKIIDDLLK